MLVYIYALNDDLSLKLFAEQQFHNAFYVILIVPFFLGCNCSVLQQFELMPLIFFIFFFQCTPKFILRQKSLACCRSSSTHFCGLKDISFMRLEWESFGICDWIFLSNKALCLWGFSCLA